MPYTPPKRYKVQRILITVFISLFVLVLASLLVYHMARRPKSETTATGAPPTAEEIRELETSKVARSVQHSHKVSPVHVEVDSKNIDIDTNSRKEEGAADKMAEKSEKSESNDDYEVDDDEEEGETEGEGTIQARTHEAHAHQDSESSAATETETEPKSPPPSHEKWLNALRDLFQKWGYKPEEIPKPIGPSATAKIESPEFRIILQGLVGKVPPEMERYVQDVLKEDEAQAAAEEVKKVAPEAEVVEEKESDSGDSGEGDEESEETGAEVVTMTAEKQESASTLQQTHTERIPPVIASMSEAQTAEEILKKDEHKLDEALAELQKTLPVGGKAGGAAESLATLNKIVHEIEEIAEKSVHEIKTRPCQETGQATGSGDKNLDKNEDEIVKMMTSARQPKDETVMFSQGARPTHVNPASGGAPGGSNENRARMRQPVRPQNPQNRKPVNAGKQNPQAMLKDIQKLGTSAIQPHPHPQARGQTLGKEEMADLDHIIRDLEEHWRKQHGKYMNAKDLNLMLTDVRREWEKKQGQGQNQQGPKSVKSAGPGAHASPVKVDDTLRPTATAEVPLQKQKAKLTNPSTELKQAVDGLQAQWEGEHHKKLEHSDLDHMIAEMEGKGPNLKLKNPLPVEEEERQELQSVIKEIGDFGKNEAKKLVAEEQKFKQDEIMEILADLGDLANNKGHLDRDHTQQLATILTDLQKASNLELERQHEREGGGDAMSRDILHALNTEGGSAAEVDEKTRQVQSALNGSPMLPAIALPKTKVPRRKAKSVIMSDKFTKQVEARDADADRQYRRQAINRELLASARVAKVKV